MDIKQLRYFIAVAEELSFVRAANRLHMSQPPLSQQIKALEDEIGVQLLHRTKRDVSLTDAGKRLLTDGRAIVEQVRLAAEAAVRTATGEVGALRIGMVNSALFHVMPLILERMREHYPAVQIEISDIGSQDQIRAIEEGGMDIGVIHAAATGSGIEKHAIFSEPFSVVLPVGHPMAGKPDLTLSDLSDELFIAFSRQLSPSLFDAFIASCLEAGFSPKIRHHARQVSSIMQMVHCGLGISFVPSSFQKCGFDGVEFRPMTASTGRVNMFAVWRAKNASELVKRIGPEIVSWFAGHPCGPDRNKT